MESEDEDVIFENSVLHQTLMDIGITDLKTEPRLQIEEDSGTRPESSRETNRLTCVTETKKSCKLHSGLFTKVFYSAKVIEEVHNYYRYHMLKWLISSHLLSEEDQMFLQSYVDEKSPTRDPSKCLSVFTSKFICMLMVSLILVNVLCPADQLSSWWMLLLACMPPVLSGLDTLSHALSFLLLNLIWMLFVAGPLLLLKKRACQQILSQLEEQDRHIKDVVLGSVELLQLERKCLRLVKESELVARGFTIASQHHVSSRGSQTNSSSSFSSDQLCPALREVMFSENVHVMQEIKKWVVKMLRGIPMICADSDFSTLEDMKGNASSLGPTDDIHVHLASAGSEEGDADGDQHAKGDVDMETDLGAHHRSFSPSELSRSVGLLSVYLSGFVRRLALCFYPENLRDKTVNPYEATRECTEMSGKAIKKATSLLKQSYTFYRAFNKSDDTTAAKKVQKSKCMSQSQTYNLYICVNSLDLHLQSLLHVTRNLAMNLEDRVDKEQSRLADKDTGNNTELRTISEDDKVVWEDILKRIKSSLESCRGCYEESVKHLCQRTEKDRTTNAHVKEVSHDVTASTQTKVIVVAAEDPVIVDQVFEAVVDTDEDEDYPEPRRIYSAEHKVKQQEDKEAIQRFRQELQTVVGHRAIFQKAREERALARARGEAIPDEEMNQQEQPLDGVLEQQTVIVKQNEDGLAAEKLEPVCAVNTHKLQAEASLVSATEVEPSIPGEAQLIEQDLGIFPPVQDRKTQSIIVNKIDKVSQSSVHEREHHRDDSSPSCCEPSSSYNSGDLSDQCSCDSSNHELGSQPQADLSQGKCVISENSRVEFVSQEDENSTRVSDDSLHSPPAVFHSMNFTKNLALLAASQARALTSSYLVEEQFGDDSSDSDDEMCGIACE
ncbi:hypothetical protein BsWGS_12038 [Bradybaena similaris]